MRIPTNNARRVLKLVKGTEKSNKPRNERERHSRTSPKKNSNVKRTDMWRAIFLPSSAVAAALGNWTAQRAGKPWSHSPQLRLCESVGDVSDTNLVLHSELCHLNLWFGDSVLDNFEACTEIVETLNPRGPRTLSTQRPHRVLSVSCLSVGRVKSQNPGERRERTEEISFPTSWLSLAKKSSIHLHRG